MKVFSWNVNGIRANLNKGGLFCLIKDYSPDIICVQETKAKPGQVEVDFPDYEEYWNSAIRPGYSGTAIFTKQKPLSVQNTLPTSVDFKDSFGDPLEEGRVQTMEFEEFFLVNVYTPNSKRELERLRLRQQLWDPAFLAHLKNLERRKPVIVCGDFNAAHTEIDLARPENNHKNAGFTDEEREGITNLIDAGFIDSFRFLSPEARRYTWWSHIGHAREKNIGWRIDYFFVSQALAKKLKSAEIYEEVLGSDHCPISIEVEL